MKKKSLFVGLSLVIMALSACNSHKDAVFLESQLVEAEEVLAQRQKDWEQENREIEQLVMEDLALVSLDELTETEIKDINIWFDANNPIKYPLIAQIPEEAIYLYGYTGMNIHMKGVILRVDDKVQAFPWTYSTSRANLPELYSYDLDGDGEKEIICITHSGSGTNISIDEVRVLKKMADGNYEAYLFVNSECERQLQEAIAFEYDAEQNTLYFRTAENEASELYYNVGMPNSIPEAVAYNSVIYFYFEGETLKLQALPVLFGEGVGSGVFTTLNVRADINYQNGDFILENISFTEETYPPIKSEY